MTVNHRVAGSSPATTAIFCASLAQRQSTTLVKWMFAVQIREEAPWGYSSVGRALPLQGRCHWFKSSYLHNLCECNSIGRVPAFQAGCCGFEAHRSLFRGVAQSGSAPALGAGCRRFKSYHPDHGEVSEWPKELVLKTSVGQPTVGSNPTLSAINRDKKIRRKSNEEFIKKHQEHSFAIH